MNQMKCSVSMTSLESPQKVLRTPEGQQKKPWPAGRQCCSLSSKKPRRTLDKKMWRRSWGSNNDDSCQEEFWRMCQQSVQELVEANSDEHGLRHFLENYSKICEWLNCMQIERGRFVDALRLSELAEDMIGKHHWRVEVNETAKNLSQKYPNLKEEFQWRIKHLNSQWDALDKILSRHRNSTAAAESILTKNNQATDCDLDWVRDWLRQKESELQPLNFRTEWTSQLLDQEIHRYKAIQAEIEEKASSIHGVLRQCQSRGRSSSSTSEPASNSKENSKRSRLETRWLQLRLRVLEWVQHLSGVAERQKNLKKGRRSDIYYTASNWDSDGDSNEPLRKCPKFDDDSDCQLDELTVFSNTTATACCDEEFISSGDLCNFSQEDGNQEVLKLNQQQQQPEEHLVGNGFSLHTIPFTEEQYSHHQLSYRNGSIISNHGQLTEQVVPGPSSCSVSQQDQVLLLNQQQHKQRKGSRGEQRECQQNGSVVSVTLNEVDFERMGQSHDSENVFSQSEPQFPNSAVEFTFDVSQSVGMKRKLSSPSASPPLTPSTEALQFQQVVPRNISIYYFKHSDTEQEQSSQQHHQNNGDNQAAAASGKSPQQSRRVSRAHCENSVISKLHSSEATGKLANCTCTPRGGSSAIRRNSRHHICQKSRLFLDFDQEFEDDITSLKSYDEISFGSFDLDLDEDLEEDETIAPRAVPEIIGGAHSGDAIDQVGLGTEEADTITHHPHRQLNSSELANDEEEAYSMMDLDGNFCSDDIAPLLSGAGEQREQKHSFSSSKSNSTGSVNHAGNNSNKPLVRLDEIEELVQKAELLVQKTTRSRGVVDCADLPVQVGSSEDDDEDDETLMLPQKHCEDQHHHHVHHYHHHHHHNHHHREVQQQNQDVMMIAPAALTSTTLAAGNNHANSRSCGIGGSSNSRTTASGEIARGTGNNIISSGIANNNGNGHGSQELLHSSSSYSVRKCSVSSSVSSSSASAAPHAHHSHKVVKSTLSALSSWSISGGAATKESSGLPQVSCRNNCSSNQNNNINNTAMSNNGKGMPILGAGGVTTSSHNNVSCCANNNNHNGNGVGESAVTSNCTGVSNCNASGPVSSSSKTSKKSSRVRKWIRAHNSEIVVNQKNTSSCDASAESASDSEFSTSSDSEQPVSSDDPTTVSTSTFLHQTHAVLLEANAKALSTCSSTNNIYGSGYCLGVASLSPSTIKSHRSPIASTSDVGVTSPPLSGIGPGASGTVPLRSKKRLSYGKQRPKSFTDTTLDEASAANNNGPSVGSPGRTWLRTSPSYFVSDSAINLLGSRSANSSSEGSGSSSAGDCACSPNSNVDSPSHPKTKKGTSRFKKRSQKGKKKIVQNEDTAIASAAGDNIELIGSSILRSSSFTESASGPLSGEKGHPSDGADQSSITTSSPKPNFLISGLLSHQPFTRLNSDNGSMNTEELNIALNDQADWDSYQEKYLSEPYSEEPYDPDGTLKLLAFGEDYGQYLDRADSESSSMLSGFEPADSRKRRPLTLANRSEMADSDSDREELNYLLRQSSSQLRFINGVFKEVLAKAENSGETTGKYAEMEATCDENIGSLQLVLTNVEETENLPFEVDVKSYGNVLESWHILKEKIQQAANIHHIKEEMGDLKMDFSNVHSLFCNCKHFDITDMESLKEKIRSIEDVLTGLPSRKKQLQHLNDSSLKSQVLLEDQDTVGIIKQQLNELYVLYEDNLQLGTFLLEKMRYLQDAWEQFEKEKQEFEKSVNVGNLRTKLRKEFSSSASTDSGHGTDFSHDSSISDSDMEYQERHKKLVALKERAKKVKAFLPPGSPVFSILDQSVEEAEKGLSSLKQNIGSTDVIDFKSLYPRKKPFAYSRRSSGQKSPKSKSLSPPPKRAGRRWTVVRRMVMFNMALMGFFLAAAYFLHPKCCEFTNTFCFSLVPHLTHESLPPI